jgi:hypothetical protein
VARLQLAGSDIGLPTLHYVLHSISHLIDIGDATMPWIGVFDLVMRAVGPLVQVIVLW